MFDLVAVGGGVFINITSRLMTICMKMTYFSKHYFGNTCMYYFSHLLAKLCIHFMTRLYVSVTGTHMVLGGNGAVGHSMYNCYC